MVAPKGSLATWVIVQALQSSTFLFRDSSHKLRPVQHGVYLVLTIYGRMWSSLSGCEHERVGVGE